MPKKLNILGEKFGRLLVLEEFETEKKRSYWRCLCDCGNISIVLGGSLTSGKTLSCGCYRDEARTAAKTKHGMCGTRTYRIYRHLIARCCNPKAAGYENYGGKGIKVSSRWIGVDGFKNFYEDMGRCPSSKHSIDRIDGTIGYFTENCRWATRSVQGFNQKRRDTNTSGRTGVYYDKLREKWVAQITKDRKTTVLYYGDSFKDAVKSREDAEIKYFGWVKE